MAGSFCRRWGWRGGKDEAVDEPRGGPVQEEALPQEAEACSI